MPVNPLVQDYSSRFQTPRIKFSDETWKAHGLSTFGTENVPFSGRTGEIFVSKLVSLYVFRLKEINKSKKELKKGVHIYEFGIGTGNLSKRFLDILKKSHPEIYLYTHLHLSDISVPLIKKIMNEGIFKAHHQHVQFEVADASQPHFTDPPFFVFHTYLADSLPARHIRITNGKAYEVLIKTTVKADAQVIDTTGFPPKILTPNATAHLIKSGQFENKLELIHQFINSIDEDTKLRKIHNITNFFPKEKSDLTQFLRSVHQDGAFNYSFQLRNSTKKIIKKLEPHGMLVISDFGHTTITNIAEQLLVSAYGNTLACPVSFPTLTNLANSLKVSHVLTHNTPGYPQVILFDTSKHPKKLANKFSKLFAKYVRPELDAYLRLANQISQSTNPSAKRFNQLFRSMPKPYQSDFQVINNFAQYLLNSKLPKEAIKFTNKVLVDHYHIATTAYRIKGLAYSQLEQYDKAEATFKQSLKIAPDDYLTLAHLAETYYKQAKYDDFVKTMSDYFRHTRQNDYIKSLIFTAKAMWELKAYEAAKKMLVETITLGDQLHTLSQEELNYLTSAKEQINLITKPDQKN